MASPIDAFCPRCRALPGECCRNYLGKGCGSHRERRGKPPKPVQPTLWPDQPTLFGEPTAGSLGAGPDAGDHRP